MRKEIKFRAIDKHNKKVYFFTLEDIDVFKEAVGVDFDWGDFILMQFTGLSDKNGKEIYEGDIVLYEDTESEYVDVGIGVDMKVAEMGANSFFPVEFRNGSFGIKVKDSELLPNDWYSMEQFANETSAKEMGDGMEIIGNIYQDKDLLN